MSWAKYAGFHFATKAGIAPQASSGTVTGTGFDRLGYDHMVATLHSGSFAGTALDVHFEHSSDDSSYSDFTPNVLFDSNNQNVTYAAFPQMTTTGIDKLDVDLTAAKRYIRAVGVSTGGENTYSVQCLINQRNGTAPGYDA